MDWKLQNNIRAWVMAATKLGPGVGDIHYLVGVNTAYYSWLRDDLRVEPSKIHHTLASGYDALTASRNDCLLAYPGAYVQTAEQAWAKAQTHLIGLGGPNQLGDYSEPNVAFYSSTTTVANILNITGTNCMFFNFTTNNAGANAACLSAVKLAAYGCYFDHVRMAGCMAATQAATALACSLWIRGAGMYPIFNKCTIGHDVWTTRTGTNQGVILFNESNTQANGGQFIDCDILSVCETATGNFVAVVGNNVLGRGWQFRNCTFNNYTTGTRMDQAFYQSASNSIADRGVMLKDCILNTKGCDCWQDSDYGNIYGNQPASASTGGLVAEISE